MPSFVSGCGSQHVGQPGTCSGASLQASRGHANSGPAFASQTPELLLGAIIVCIIFLFVFSFMLLEIITINVTASLVIAFLMF